MDFQNAVKSALNNYMTFEGRASRPEYWWFVLFYVIVYVGALVIDSILGMGAVTLLVSLGLFFPCLSVTARRLHDINKSGWWQLLYFIPVLGMLVMIYFLAQKGDPLPNRFDVSAALS